MRRGLAAVFLGLFALLWLDIARDLRDFEPTDSQPKFELSDNRTRSAGFLAASVGAATAAALGIVVLKVKTNNTLGATANALAKASKEAPLVAISVLVYALVGAALFWVYQDQPNDVAPEAVGTFAWGFLGWLGAIFYSIVQPAS
jgi:hypothetical protein